VHSERIGSVVVVRIDAAVTAKHRVVVRQPEAGGPGVVVDDFEAGPTIAGLEKLSKRLSAYPGAVAVAEPTSMTWLPLSVALGRSDVRSEDGPRQLSRSRAQSPTEYRHRRDPSRDHPTWPPPTNGRTLH
jgi:hypothetical protein